MSSDNNLRVGDTVRCIEPFELVGYSDYLSEDVVYCVTEIIDDYVCVYPLGRYVTDKIIPLNGDDVKHFCLFPFLARRFERCAYV